MVKLFNKLLLLLVSGVTLLLTGLFSSAVRAESLKDKQVDVYLQSLALTKQFGEFRKVLKKAIQSTKGDDLPRLMHLAQLGIENNATAEAAKAYEKLLKHDPNNLTAVRNIGMILFWNRKYTPALKFLTKYNKETGGDYMTNYSQGELMYILRKDLGPTKDSKPSFEKAYQEATRLGSSIKAAEIVRAKSLFRLGKYVEALSSFDSLMRKYPDDIFILIDYARMLLDTGFEKEAYEKLQMLPENLYAKDSLKKYKLTKKQKEDVIVRVMTMRISYYREKQYFFTVKKMEMELKKHYPKQPDAALSRAMYYASYQNWRAELKNIELALESYPEDQTWTLEKQRILRQHGSFIEYKPGVRLSDNNGVELLNEARIELRISDNIRLGVNYINDVAWLHDVPRMDGNNKNFHGVRNQWEIFLQGDFINGDTAKLSYYDHDGIPGIGAEYTMLDYWGSTRLNGTWRKPYWGQQQAIAERGSRTFIELERVFRPFERLTLSAVGSFNSYGLEHSEDLARSFAFGAKAEYQLPSTQVQRFLMGEQSAITLNYELDAEYFTRFRKNSQGINMYAPDDRQLHSFYVGLYSEVTTRLKLSATGGYTYDVLGDGSGMIYGGNIAYLITEELEASANVSHVVSTNTYFYAGIGLKYSFTPLTLIDIINKYWIVNK